MENLLVCGRGKVGAVVITGIVVSYIQARQDQTRYAARVRHYGKRQSTARGQWATLFEKLQVRKTKKGGTCGKHPRERGAKTLSVFYGDSGACLGRRSRPGSGTG